MIAFNIHSKWLRIKHPFFKTGNPSSRSCSSPPEKNWKPNSAEVNPTFSCFSLFHWIFFPCNVDLSNSSITKRIWNASLVSTHLQAYIHIMHACTCNWVVLILEKCGSEIFKVCRKELHCCCSCCSALNSNPLFPPRNDGAVHEFTPGLEDFNLWKYEQSQDLFWQLKHRFGGRGLSVFLQLDSTGESKFSKFLQIFKI